MKPAATALAIALASAAAIAGCGSSGGETTSAPEPLKRAGGSNAPPGASVKKCGTAIVADGALGSNTLGDLRVSGVGCETGAAVMTSWLQRGCRPAKGESRSSCTVRRYRCLSVRTAHGISVNCARRGRSISFRWKQ